MNLRLFTTPFFLFCSLAFCAGTSEDISFYAVKPADKAPVIDGKLDEKCWQATPVYKKYYVYWNPNPGPGLLKTELRMVYDANGVYLGIVNYDDNIGNIRKSITSRDEGDLWRDDCAEIFFDPYTDGKEYTRFTINAIGTQGESRKADGNLQHEWDSYGWETKTALNQDAWVIEAFFPWDDLGRKALAGDMWKFCHVRYGYSSGKFIGVTSSPGGNNSMPQHFGYIYFTGKETPSRDEIGKIMSTCAGPQWSLLIDDGLLIYDGKKPEYKPFQDLLAREKLAFEERGKEISGLLNLPANKELSEKYAALKKQGEEIKSAPCAPEEQLGCLKKMAGLNDALNKLYWQMKLNEIAN